MTIPVPLDRISAPSAKATLVGRVLENLRHKGDQAFLRILDAELKAEEISFRDFFLRALVTASLYDRFRVARGAKVILILSNPRDVFFAFAGALLTGRVPIVSAHPSSKLPLADFSRTLLPLIDNAEPALIVGDPEICAYVSASIGRRVASLDDIVVPKTLPQAVNAGNPALFIQYSSGTTGAKKGVMISEEQLLWQIDAYAAEIALAEDDHIVSWLPYYHDMGLLTALLLPLVTGTTTTIMSPFDWVKNPLAVLRAVSQYRGTLMWLPNFSYNFLAHAASRAKNLELELSSLRGVVNCSEPVSAASHELFLRTFSPYGLRSSALAVSYAMAETTFAVTSGGFARPLRRDHIDRTHLRLGEATRAGTHTVVSSGRALPGTEVRIFDAGGAVLGARHLGEIGVRSPSLMSGYFKNPAAAAYAGDFFLTGDLGYLDDGEVFVTGRIKDLIIAAGRNIYPQDIEAAVNDVAGVSPGRCVAFGMIDEAIGTESVVVIAESKADATVESTELARTISRTVAGRFDIRLADVLVVEPGWLVKSTSGKIARGQNRERYAARRKDKSVHAVVDSSLPEDIIRRCIHDTTGNWIEDAAAPLVTSGIIDSLALTNLMLALEDAFQKPLPMPSEVGYGAYDSIAAIGRIVSSGYVAKAEPFVFVIDRQVKVNYALEGPRNFDALILGSSRSYLIRSKLAEKFGLRAFQFAVAGVRFEELYAMAEFFSRTNRTPLKHIIIGTDPIQFAPHLPIDLRCERTPALFSLLEDADRQGRAGLGLEDADMEKKSDRLQKLMQMRYGAWDVDIGFDPVSGDIIRLFGHDVETMTKLNYAPVSGAMAEQFLVANRIRDLHPRRLHYLDKLLRLVETLGCKLTLYTNPLPPPTISELREHTPYVETQHRLVSEIKARAGGKAEVHELLTPQDFGGIDDDYFDAAHMGRRNGDRLLEYLLGAAAKS